MLCAVAQRSRNLSRWNRGGGDIFLPLFSVESEFQAIKNLVKRKKPHHSGKCFSEDRPWSFFLPRLSLSLSKSTFGYMTFPKYDPDATNEMKTV